MSSQMKTVMGVLSFVGGEWSSESPQVLAVSEPAAFREAAKGDLFVLIDPLRADGSSPLDAQRCRALTATIRNTYYHSPGGVIASLRRALLMIERDALFFELLAGLLAVVVRGKDVFIASAGRMVVFLVHDEEVQRFPERATDAARLDEYAEPLFFHISAQPGDVLVLGDSRFSAMVSSADIAVAVAYQELEDALAALGDLVAGEDCTAVLVALEAEGAEPARLAPSTMVTALGGVLPHVGRVAAFTAKGLSAALVLAGRALRELLIQMLPERKETAPLHEMPPAEEAMRMTEAPPPPAGERGEALIPPVSSPVQLTQVEVTERKRAQMVWRLVAIILPLLVAGLVGFIYWREGVNEENTFQMLMEQARTVYQQALNADEPTARRLLDKAVELLEEAALLRPDHAARIELYTNVLHYQDKIDRVQRLPSLVALRRYDHPSTMLRRVVIDGLDVYVLDHGADIVYVHRMDAAVESLVPEESEPVVVQRAQKVGGNVVGELVDMTWSAAGRGRQVSALLVLEAGGLLEYSDARGVASLTIGGRERWKLPVAAMGYGGNFYILDPEAGQIFRYRPGEGGYPGAPENYFPQTSQQSLVGAVDMAIDGYIYVLYSTGKVAKFEGGTPITFEISGLDRPLSSPTAIFTAPEQQVHYLYIADAGNRRIVQLEKDGRFVRQLKPPIEGEVDFATLRSLFVDEIAGKIYLVDSRTLYLATLPPVP